MTSTVAALRPAANDGAALEPADGAVLRLAVPVRFVTIEVAAVLTGYSPAAIRAMIAKGIWLEDRQYVRRNGRVLIDLEGYNTWAETGRA